MTEFVFHDRLREGVEKAVIKRLEQLTDNLPEQLEGVNLKSEGIVKTVTDYAIGTLRPYLDVCMDAAILQLTQGIRFCKTEKGRRRW